MKTVLQKIIPVLFFFFFAAVSYAYQAEISADELEYDQTCGVIKAKGNVVLSWQDMKVNADYVEFFIEEKQMSAYGNVRSEESGNVLFAEGVTYRYDEETGEIKKAAANSSSIFMHADSMERLGKNSFAVHNIKISNCDHDEPHVYFKSKKGKLTLNERVTIYNAVFYIGKIPVFYLPIISLSLKGGREVSSKFSYEIEPGYTSDGGLSLKNSVKYRFTDSFVGKAMLDYYGTRGWGTGLQFNYSKKNVKGSLYSYYIQDLSAGYNRWTLRPYYWQKINNKWSIQSQAEFISDETFNNYYSDDWNRVKSSLHSYFSITRQDGKSNLVIALDRKETYDTVTGDYEVTSMQLPRVTLNIYPKKIIAGIIHNFSLNYANTYRQYGGGKFYKNTADATYTLSRDFKFGRKFTLKPSIGLTEEWYDKDDYENFDSTFITKYFASLNSRLRVTKWMDWNVNYNISARTKENSLLLDREANDYGIASNSLSLVNYMYVGDRTTVRNYITYNLTQYRNSPPVRWSPLVNEIVYTPKHYMTVYLRQTQTLDPFRFNSAQLDATLGELEKVYFNLGAFYQYYDEATNPTMAYRNKEMDNTIGFGLWLTPKWRLDYNIKITSRLDKTYSRMNEHEFKLYRDLHCYNLGVTWKIRGVYHDVYFKFDMKTNMPFSKNANINSDNEESEEIFYPWR